MELPNPSTKPFSSYPTNLRMVDTSAITAELPHALAVGAGALAASFAASYLPSGIPAEALLVVGGIAGGTAYNYSGSGVISPDLAVKTLVGAGGAILGAMYMPGPVGIVGGGALGDLVGAYVSP